MTPLPKITLSESPEPTESLVVVADTASSITVPAKVPKIKAPPKLKLNPLLAEAGTAANAERLWCQQCGLFEHCQHPFTNVLVPVDWTGQLLIVDGEPSKERDSGGEGRLDKLLRKLWRAAGYRDSDVAICFAIRCRPDGSKDPSMRSVRACRGFVLHAIQTLKPRYIVGLGVTAARSLTNDGDATVGSLRGRVIIVPGLVSTVHSAETTLSELSFPDVETISSGISHELYSSVVFITYHPRSTLYSREGKTISPQLILEDLRRAADPTTQPPGFTLPAGSPRVVAIDAEWSKDGTVTTASVATTEACLAVEGYPDFFRLAPVLRGASWLAAHSAAQDIEKLIGLHLPIRESWAKGEQVLDSVLLARMTDENLPSYKLEDLLSGFCTIDGWKQETESELKKSEDMGTIDAELRSRRCAIDAWAAAKIVEKYAPVLRAQSELLKFTHRIASTLSRFSLAGAFVNNTYFKEIGDQLGRAKDEAEDKLRKAALAAGLTEFSPTNDDHLRELLFSKLGLEPLEHTRKEKLPSVDKTTLANLDHPVAKLVLDFNHVEKQYSTNIVGVGELLKPVGLLNGVPVSLLPFNFNPLGARTGRRSSNDPNSQNWPKEMRQIVRSRFAGGTIAACDYQKLEPRVMSWVTGEGYLWDRFGPNGDGYIGIARDMWHKDVPEDSPLYKATKSIVLGVHYNMQTRKMAWQLWNAGIKFSADYAEHEHQTDELREAYLGLIPKVVSYMDQQERKLLRDGWVASATGAIRHLPLPNKDEDYKQWRAAFGHALNQAINFPIQRLASDVAGAALIDVEGALLRERGVSYVEWIELLQEVRRKLLTNPGEIGIITQEIGASVLFNEVHDELTVDLYPPTATRDLEIIRDGMTKVRTLRKLVPNFDIPLGVDIKQGTAWSLKDAGV